MRSEEGVARCEHVVKTYRSATSEVRALQGVSVEVPRSAVTAVMGPSGSGKSTLLRLLAGMDRPTSGVVEVEGVDVGSAPGRVLRELRGRTVGFVFQRPSDNFLPYLTVGEHLGLAGGRSGPSDQDPLELLDRLGIANRADHLPAQLSGGEQQRAAFAQVLTMGARIVVADEPTAELDQASARSIMETMRALVDSGVTVVVATHDRAMVRVADEIVELDHGRLRGRRASHQGSEPFRGPEWSQWSIEDSSGSGRPVVLDVRDVRKSYRRGAEIVHAVTDASFVVHTGELVGVVGRSGSGKTTLLNILGGWERADGGTVAWTGLGSLDGAPQWGQMAVLPQRLGLIDELTVRQNVEYPARLAGRLQERAEVVEELFDRLGLTELADRYPREVSVGEQQRASLARALVLSPPVLLADEPTAHQDHGWTQAAFDVLREMTVGQTSCLVATHDDAIVRHLDRVLVMSDGHLTSS